jgi:hypothetical protein
MASEFFNTLVELKATRTNRKRSGDAPSSTAPRERYLLDSAPLSSSSRDVASTVNRGHISSSGRTSRAEECTGPEPADQGIVGAGARATGCCEVAVAETVDGETGSADVPFDADEQVSETVENSVPR